MPTARNAKGVDIIAFNQNASRKITIQVKTLSKKNPVPLGAHMENLVADYVVVCVRNYPNEPMCFVLTPDEFRKLAHRGEKNGRVSYWLQTSAYNADTYKEQWKRIGSGVTKGG